MNKDFLSRQPYINLLKSIITNQCENTNGYSFAIDGEWGCGKTWILNELENQLDTENTNKYLIFHYNAWENDFYEEPLVSILSVMIENLKKQKKSIKENGTIRKVITSSINALTKVACSVVEKKYEINPNDIIDSLKDTGNAIGNLKLTKSDFNKLLPLENALVQIQSVIRNLSKDKKIILIVDELDRCLPEYTIKVLERLHHICNEMPMIQILSISKKQLADSIAIVFGKNYSNNNNIQERNSLFADSYLQKFVDVIIPLPNGKLDNKLDVLNDLEKAFKNTEIKDRLGNDFITLDENFLLSFIITLMDGIDRRLQEKIFKQVALCHKLTIESGIKYNDEQMSFAILIYEILSCISKFIFHHKYNCRVFLKESQYSLEFYDVIYESSTLEEKEYKRFNSNLRNYFNIASSNMNHDYEGFHIYDTKSYVMAFFTEKPNIPYYSFEGPVWNWIEEDKIFLNKFDEIMNMLVLNKD